MMYATDEVNRQLFSPLQVKKALARHGEWLTSSGCRGQFANLSMAALRRADFEQHDLRYVDFSSADLSEDD